MPDTRMYSAPWLDLNHLSEMLQNWLRSQEFETQVLDTPGGLTIQARKTKFLQHGVALTIMLVQNGDNLQAQVGTGKWILHAAEGVAALILFWPLLAIPAFSAYKLKETMDDTWNLLARYVAAEGELEIPAMPGYGAATAPVARPASNSARCPSCGTAVAKDAKFCGNCGAKLQIECPECGARLRSDAKFCDGCGAKIADAV